MVILKKTAGTMAVFFLTSGSIFAAESATRLRMLECATIANASQRLVCFDQLTAEFSIEDDTQAEPDTIVATANTQPQNFKPGQDNQINELDGEYHAAPEPVPKPNESASDKVRLSLIETNRDRLGRWVFTFGNGEIWRQIEDGYLSIPERYPIAAEISPGAFGSHSMRIGDRGRRIKITRLR